MTHAAENDAPDVAAALKLQRDSRARAGARMRALQRLKDAHPEEYRRLYDEERGVIPPGASDD